MSTVMTSGTATSSRSGRLPVTVAFYLQASILLFFLAGSSAPTPLYSLYQSKWGFSPITTTMVFGVYAMAVLIGLLTVGSLSEHLGRRPLLLTAVGLQAVTMLLFATASGVPELMAARIVQGLSTGAVAGALGAGLLDLHRTRGTVANAVGAMLGTATGAIGSALLVQFVPAPTHVVYLVLFAVFLVQAVGVWLMGESVTRKPGAIASLRPQFGVPRPARGALFIAVPALVAVWALAGFYGSLGPTLVRLVARSNSSVLGALPLFMLAATGVISVLLLRSAHPRKVMFLGTIALLVGVGATLLAISANSALVFFIGTAIAGVGFGAGFQGALRTVMPLAAPHERAGLLSTVYVVSYLAMGLPAVIAGFLVVYSGGVLTTGREYGLAVMVLAAVALLGLLRARSSVQPPVAPVAHQPAPLPALAEVA